MTSSTQAFLVLHESAAGYALFDVVAFDEIGSLLEGSMNTVCNRPLFMKAVHLKAFQPFDNAVEALENINAVSERAMTSTLKSFLEMNLSGIDGKKISLGIIDSGLATAIAEGMAGIKKFSCRSDDTVKEILRGVRLHLTHFIKGLENGAAEQAQLGLGHSYSRSKVKFNPARSDNMIIQSIALLDQMDKDLNTFSMRIREWYSWHFPELKDLVKDNYMFARAAAFVQDKSSLTTLKRTVADDDDVDDEKKMEESNGELQDKLPGLIEIVGDEELAQAIVAASKTSMGMDCSPVDMVNIVNFTQRMIKMAEYRKQLTLYLSEKMGVVAPNLSTLLGDSVAARLISKAGSLTNLAKAPASTVQILGAEKALFRALKTKGNTPKYGLIYHSTFIGRADTKNKGRISRYLANKCSIATRIDSFSDDPSREYGKKLREQVEERLKFYETGAQPRKNIDVMEEVARHLAAGKSTEDIKMEVDDDSGDEQEKKKKKKKDKKKRKLSEDVVQPADDDGDKEEEPKEKKSKKSKKKKKETQVDDNDEDEETPKKENKNKKDKDKKDKKDKKSKRKSQD